MINLCLLIVCLQETLPEEAAGHNPLLPAVPQQDETSPTSKVIFILSSSPPLHPLLHHQRCFPTFKLDEGKKVQLLSATSLVSSNDLAALFYAACQPLWEFLSPTSTSLSFQLDVRWNMIACGKTRPSIEMTEHARQYLSGIKPRSLNL